MNAPSSMKLTPEQRAERRRVVAAENMPSTKFMRGALVTGDVEQCGFAAFEAIQPVHDMGSEHYPILDEPDPPPCEETEDDA